MDLWLIFLTCLTVGGLTCLAVQGGLLASIIAAREEEDFEEGATDIPVAMTARGKEVTLLQLDGDVTKDEVMEAIKVAKKGCDEIHKIQTKVLKEIYKNE